MNESIKTCSENASLLPEQKQAETVHVGVASCGCGSGAPVAKLDWLPDSLKKGRQEKAPPGYGDILYFITQYIRLYSLWP